MAVQQRVLGADGNADGGYDEAFLLTAADGGGKTTTAILRLDLTDTAVFCSPLLSGMSFRMKMPRLSTDFSAEPLLDYAADEEETDLQFANPLSPKQINSQSGRSKTQPIAAMPLNWAWAGLSFFCSGRWLMVLRHD